MLFSILYLIQVFFNENILSMTSCFQSIVSNYKVSLTPRRLKLSRLMRKRTFIYAKTKAQISFAVTAKLISAFVFVTRIVYWIYIHYIQNFQSLAILCACTARFVSNLSGNNIVGFLMTRLKYVFYSDILTLAYQRGK